MKKILLFTTLLCVVLPVVAQQQQPQQPEPQFKLREFQMVLLKRGPKAVTSNWENSDLRKQHLAYVQALLEADKALIAGQSWTIPSFAASLSFARSRRLKRVIG